MIAKCFYIMNWSHNYQKLELINLSMIIENHHIQLGFKLIINFLDNLLLDQIKLTVWL